MTHDESVTDLASQLRQYRREAGLSGADLGAKVGLSQSKISRIERAKLVPTEHEVKAIANALALDLEIVSTLVAKAKDAESFGGVAEVVSTNLWQVQEEIHSMERRSTSLDKFNVTVLTGMLQTPEYAEAVVREAVSELTFFDGDTTEFVVHTVVLRLQRQAELFDRRKTLQVILTDNVLTSVYGSTEIQINQLRHLLNLDVPNVEVRVVDPANMRCRREFDLFDEKAVCLESQFSQCWVYDPRQVTMYSQIFRQMWSSARRGDEAKARIQSAIDALEHGQYTVDLRDRLDTAV